MRFLLNTDNVDLIKAALFIGKSKGLTLSVWSNNIYDGNKNDNYKYLTFMQDSNPYNFNGAADKVERIDVVIVGFEKFIELITNHRNPVEISFPNRIKGTIYTDRAEIGCTEITRDELNQIVEMIDSKEEDMIFTVDMKNYKDEVRDIIIEGIKSKFGYTFKHSIISTILLFDFNKKEFYFIYENNGGILLYEVLKGIRDYTPKSTSLRLASGKVVIINAGIQKVQSQGYDFTFEKVKEVKSIMDCLNQPS